MKKVHLLMALPVLGGFSSLGLAATVLSGTSNLNSSSGGDYTNASSIAVSSTDLIEGLTPISTNYVGTNEANGGTLAVLTDGTTGTPPSAPTTASNAAFDLGNGNWYAEYDLGSSKAIGSIQVTTGHQDFRLNQHYDLLYSNDGTNFTSLSNGSTQTLGNLGGTFDYAPSAGAGGAAQTTLSDNASTTLATARYVEIVVTNNGEDVYREIDVNAAPTPEPATLSLLGLTAVGLLSRRRRA